jgi:mono/diheme cytochrome c family protein
MKRATISIGIAAGVVLAVAAALLGGIVGPPQQGRADPRDERQVALGERVYREQCAACHGANLEGQPEWQVRRPDGRMPAPPHSESGHTWHHADEVLFRITKDGLASLLPGYESDMPPYADILTDAEIWAVLAFIKSTWPPVIQARQEDINRRGDQAR